MRSSLLLPALLLLGACSTVGPGDAGYLISYDVSLASGSVDGLTVRVTRADGTEETLAAPLLPLELSTPGAPGGRPYRIQVEATARATGTTLRARVRAFDGTGRLAEETRSEGTAAAGAPLRVVAAVTPR
ncbi:MAG: hypothetical protein ACK41D_00515 [Rubricoccaceae bacterium]